MSSSGKFHTNSKKEICTSECSAKQKFVQHVSYESTVKEIFLGKQSTYGLWMDVRVSRGNTANFQVRSNEAFGRVKGHLGNTLPSSHLGT